MSHPDTEILSRLLDEDLSPEEARRLAAHLEGCGSCRALLGGIEEVRRLAGELPDRLPPRDLWPDIARALERGIAAEPEVIPIRPSLSGPGKRARVWRGFRLSYPQAAAAGLALALLSGVAGGWLAREGGVERAASAPQRPAWVQQVEQATPELGGAAEEVARLEDLLLRHREELDPSTIRILEKSMGAIDQAIRESLAALELDPGNRFLRDHLQWALQAKADYLRDATALVAPVS